MSRGQSTAAVIRRGDQLFLVQRKPGGDLSDCWELPGGKVDEGETPAEALRRELSEELGLSATVHEEIGRSSFDHRGRRFELIAFLVTAETDRAELREHVACSWLTPENALELESLAPSDRSLIEKLLV